MNRSFAAAIACAALSFAGCGSGATPAQIEAAAALAETCAREVTDPNFQYIGVDGGRVTFTLTDEAQKLLNVFTGSENVSEDMESENFLKGAGIAMGVMTDLKCLATNAGTPTTADGSPKPGEFPGWTVTVDSDGYPTFTSTV